MALTINGPAWAGDVAGTWFALAGRHAEKFVLIRSVQTPATAAPADGTVPVTDLLSAIAAHRAVPARGIIQGWYPPIAAAFASNLAHAVLPVYWWRGHLGVGPRLDTGTCPTCWTIRLGSALAQPEAFDALLTMDLAGGMPAGTPAVAVEDPDQLIEIGAGLVQQALDHPGQAFFVSPTLGIDAQSCLPLPGCDTGDHRLRPSWQHLGKADGRSHSAPEDAARPPGATNAESQLVSRFFGPICSFVELTSRPEEPPTLRMATSRVAAVGRYLEWTPDGHGSGLAFGGDPYGPAYGEGLERYSGNFVPDGTRTASYRQLQDQDARALDPRQLAAFAPGQYEDDWFPFQRVDLDSTLEWCRADAGDGQTIWVPAATTFLNYYRTRGIKGPRQFPVALAGIAAGRTFDHAAEAALLELIERDHTGLWWLGGNPCVELEIPDGLRRRLTGPAEHVRLRWFLLAEEFGAFTCAAWLEDTRAQLLCVGFSARRTLEEGLAKSSGEAWQLRRLSADLLDPASSVWSSVGKGASELPLRVFRPGRDYAELFQGGPRAFSQLVDNCQFYLDPDTHAGARKLLDQRISGVVRITDEDLLGRSAHGAGVRPEYVVRDVTSVDVAAHDIRVARVVAPQLLGNMPTSIPLLGNQRLNSLQVAAAGRTLPGHDLWAAEGFNLYPMPHA